MQKMGKLTQRVGELKQKVGELKLGRLAALNLCAFALQSLQI